MVSYSCEICEARTSRPPTRLCVSTSAVLTTPPWWPRRRRGPLNTHLQQGMDGRPRMTAIWRRLTALRAPRQMPWWRWSSAAASAMSARARARAFSTSCPAPRSAAASVGYLGLETNKLSTTQTQNVKTMIIIRQIVLSLNYWWRTMCAFIFNHEKINGVGYVMRCNVVLNCVN